MDKRIDFNEALNSLVELAIVQGNTLDAPQIDLYFKNILDDTSKYDFIYQYLLEKKITINNYIQLGKTDNALKPLTDNEAVVTTKETPKDTDTSAIFLNNMSKLDPAILMEQLHQKAACISDLTEKEAFTMFLEDLGTITIPTEEAIINTFNSHKDLSYLLHDLLYYVLLSANSLATSEDYLNDIIQEANLALLTMLNSYSSNTKDFDYNTFITEALSTINESFKNVLNQEESASKVANRVKDIANRISDATVTLAKDLSREATLKELSDYLSLPEDEIKDIMKMSLDAINNSTEASE